MNINSYYTFLAKLKNFIVLEEQDIYKLKI